MIVDRQANHLGASMSPAATLDEDCAVAPMGVFQPGQTLQGCSEEEDDQELISLASVCVGRPLTPGEAAAHRMTCCRCCPSPLPTLAAATVRNREARANSNAFLHRL